MAVLVLVYGPILMINMFTYCYMTHYMKGNIWKDIIGALHSNSLHSSEKAFHKICSQSPFQFILKVFNRVKFRALQYSEVLPHQTHSTMSLWTLLYALLGHSHVRIEKGLCQTVPYTVGCIVYNVLVNCNKFCLEKQKPPNPPNFTVATIQLGR